MMHRAVYGLLLTIGLIVCAPESAYCQTWEPEQPGDATIAVEAFWEPMTDAMYGFDKKPVIRDLKAAEKRKTWRSSDFSVFLPNQAVKTGDAWKVDPNRVVPLLKQFHKGARAELHHGAVAAPGGWGCLSALNEEVAEISFRIHAEFLLDGDGGLLTSSWFTPAQFSGRLVIHRTSNSVVAFRMGVPSQSANVDINLSTGADIGRIPRMELVGGEFPEWPKSTTRISSDAVANLLAQRFYPFAKIDWLSLSEARQQSIKTGKPLHVIALFGSLKDESC